MEKEIDGNSWDDISPQGSQSTPPKPTTPTSLSPKAYRKFIWKIDLHVLPALFALWLVALLDRGNIGSANIFGIQKDLNMQGNDYNIAILIFVIVLICVEIPCNALLKFGSPQVILAGEIFLLGITGIGEGLVTNVAGFNVMRFFVGLFEGGLMPASVYTLAQYYPRYELQWRLGMLMLGNALGTAFSGLLAFAIAGIESGNVYHGWRWIFIVEGCITASVAVLIYPFIPNWPHQARWLSDDEKSILADIIKKQEIVTTSDEKLDRHMLFGILKDWKIWICLIVGCTTITLYSVAIFTPTIISGMAPHQDPRHVQALCIPVFIAASAATLISSLLSDYFKHRTAFALLGYVMIISGAIILLNQKHVNVHTKYGAIYLLACGIYISLPILWTILINNITGSYKMGIAIAIQVSIGNLGGIASTLCFASTKAPLFVLGYTTTIAMISCAMGLILIYTFFLWVENRSRAAGKRDYRLEGEDVDKLGDSHPAFRHTY